MLDYFFRLMFPGTRFWLVGNANRLLAHVDPKQVPLSLKWPVVGFWGACWLGLIAMIALWTLCSWECDAMRILIEEYPGSVDAARFLIAARDAGVPGPRLPADCRPQTQGQAFAVQRSTARLLRETRRDDIAAWKSALPTPEKSVVAPIYTSTVHFSAASPVPAQGAVVRVEPEIAFELARDLPARAQPYSEAEIDAAVGGAGWRWKCWVPLCAAGARQPARAAGRPHVQPGPGAGTAHRVRRRRARQHDHHAVRGRPGCRAARGHPSNGRPKAGLYWLANFLREQGAGLRAGQHVITGSYAGFLDVPAGRDLEIAYGDLGVLRLRFEARG